MKKLGLGSLIALATCTTIGGVYAAWTYAGTNDIADVFNESKVVIADVELTGANGTFHISSNLVLTVDQRDENHYAKLVFSSNDNQPVYLKATFTPSANAPANVKENAVDAELYFGTTVDMVYTMDQYGNYSNALDATEMPIFKLTPTANQVLDKNFDWEKQADGSFSYTWDQTDLESMIQLSVFTVNKEDGTGTIEDTFRLDTKAEHDAFRAALKGNIVARITDGTVN